VAVKVQRPSVETDFAGDIRLMTATVNLIKHRVEIHLLDDEPISEFIG